MGVTQDAQFILKPGSPVDKNLLETDATENATWQPVIGLLGTPTYGTLGQYLGNDGSAGLVEGGALANTGGETISVAALSGQIRSTNSHIGDLFTFDIGLTTGIAIPTNTTRYLGVSYNAGTPVIVVKTSDTWNTHDEFNIGNVVNEATVLHIWTNPDFVANHAQHIIHRLTETLRLQRANALGGIILGETGTRNITVTAGGVYDKLNEFSINAIDTSASDTFDSYSSAGLESTSDTQWDNDNYDNAGTLTSLTTNRFANLWFYMTAEDSDVVCVYGTAQYTLLSGAEAEGAPTVLPDRINAQGFIIGRIIFQKGDSVAQVIESAFDVAFNTTMATDHNSLANLPTGDVHTQYGFLGGRASGQVLNGGISASETLTLSGTLHGTPGSILLNPSGGNVGIGESSPSSLLDIKGVGGSDSGIELTNAFDSVLMYLEDNNDNADFIINHSGSGGVDISLKANGNLVLGQQGNVGVGISPVTKLHVYANVNSNNILRNENAASSGLAAAQIETKSNGNALSLTSFSTGYGGSYAGEPLADMAQILAQSPSSLMIASTSGAPIIFTVSLDQKLRLTSSGVNMPGLTISRAVFTDGSKNLVSNAITGTGNVVMSASPTLTGTLGAAAANFSGLLTATAGLTTPDQIVSTLALGTAPFAPTSTTLCTNLNADLLDGNHASAFSAAQVQDSFTVTLTGCTTSPTGTARYTISGNIVTLLLPAVTATSNSTSFTLTGLPVAIQPSGIVSTNLIMRVIDDGGSSWGIAKISNSGTIILDLEALSINWTSFGTKGIDIMTLTYQLSE